MENNKNITLLISDRCTKLRKPHSRYLNSDHMSKAEPGRKNLLQDWTREVRVSKCCCFRIPPSGPVFLPHVCNPKSTAYRVFESKKCKTENTVSWYIQERMHTHRYDSSIYLSIYLPQPWLLAMNNWFQSSETLHILKAQEDAFMIENGNSNCINLCPHRQYIQKMFS